MTSSDPGVPVRVAGAEELADVTRSMRAWAALHPEADTQGLMDDEWDGLAHAAAVPLLGHDDATCPTRGLGAGELAAQLIVAEAERDSARVQVAELREALVAAADELNRWGMGDMHYGATRQEQSVVDAVARARRVLADTDLEEGGDG